MTATVFNVAKGQVAYLAGLPAANDALIAILLQSSGLQSVATLKDYQTFAAITGGGNLEATFTSYARQTLTAVTNTVDYANDWVNVDCADITFTVGSSQALGMLVICYDNDTTSGTDANLIPLVMDDAVATTPAVGTLTYQVAAAGFFRAA